jgi:hypothetical protein
MPTVGKTTIAGTTGAGAGTAVRRRTRRRSRSQTPSAHGATHYLSAPIMGGANAALIEFTPQNFDNWIGTAVDVGYLTEKNAQLLVNLGVHRFAQLGK